MKTLITLAAGRPVFIFRDLESEKRKMLIFFAGIMFGGSAYRVRNNDSSEIGESLKQAMATREAGRWVLYAFGECLPYADNRITLNHDKKDKWGRPVITVNCEFKENERKMNADHQYRCGRIAWSRRILKISKYTKAFLFREIRIMRWVLHVWVKIREIGVECF